MIKGNSGCHGNREAQHKMRVTGGGVWCLSDICNMAQWTTGNPLHLHLISLYEI